MLIGEVDEADFEGRFATLLFVVFVFLVVILLATVLIAIVTDSYIVIRNERAAIVFWSNRLDFIVEMDVISNGFLKGLGERGEGGESKDATNGTSTQLWQSVLDVFDEDINSMEIWSFAFLFLTLLRLSIIFVIVPLWLMMGLLTAGILWPIQWRKRILEQKITDHTSKSHLSKSGSQLHELEVLKDGILHFQEGVKTKLDENENAVLGFKTDLDALKNDLTAEMAEIHSVLASLFEAQKEMNT